MKNYTNNAALSIVPPSTPRRSKSSSKPKVTLSDVAYDNRKIAKNLRNEAKLLKQTAVSVILLGFGCEAVLFFIGSYVKELIGIPGLVAIGVCGILCAFVSLLFAAIMTSASYTLQDSAKMLYKEG